MKQLLNLRCPRFVAVLPQDFSHGTCTCRHQRVVARVAGRHLGDHAAGDAVMIASGNQRGAGGRASAVV